jgi:hypothetical protein
MPLEENQIRPTESSEDVGVEGTFEVNSILLI